jgi:hypothetical protein
LVAESKTILSRTPDCAADYWRPEIADRKLLLSAKQNRWFYSYSKTTFFVGPPIHKHDADSMLEEGTDLRLSRATANGLMSVLMRSLQTRAHHAQFG